jgi:beta-mannosidase
MDWLGKGMNGNHMIDRYMSREFRKPKDFESYVYVSQLLQAQAIKTAAEAHRKNMPYTMGSIYWQINDCWPTISWSTIDYFGNWKAAHYQARDSYKEFLISFSAKNDSMKVFLVSDRLQKVKAEMRINVYDFNGSKIYSQTKSVDVKANSSVVYFNATLKELLKGRMKEDVYIKVELYEGENLLAENRRFLLPMKSLNLPVSKVETRIMKNGDTYSIEVKNDKFAKNVYLYFQDFDVNFSDNFFDMEAGSAKTITFKASGISPEDLSKKLKILNLATTY